MERTSAVLQLNQAKGFVLDMDGVLYRGDSPLPGMLDFIRITTERGIPYVFVTNNSMRTPAQYVSKLAAMGATVPIERIITSGTTAALYLRQHYRPGTRVYVIGMPALHEVIFTDETGFVLDTEAPELVVSGSDFTFTYEKLKIATMAIHRGAAWIATNADTTLPVENGLWPGAGALIAAVRAATKAEPLVLGKPEPEMMQQALHKIQVPAASAVMIGDRLDTDILGGIRSGMTTALVLTGVETEDSAGGDAITPDYVFEDLGALVKAAWPS